MKGIEYYTMKNIFNTVHTTDRQTSHKNVIIMIVIIMLITHIFNTISYLNQCYSLKTVVAHVDSNDCVVVIDSTDEIWAFYGTGFNTGDKVELTMFTNCTDSIYDDKIIKAVKLK